MTITPLSDRVLVKAITETATASGIVIPETAQKERPQHGEVVAVGPGKRLKDGTVASVAVSVGDKVMFKKYGPDEVTVDGQEYLIIDESDILAILA